MKYIPRIIGAKLGLHSDIGLTPYMPKGMKIRFDTSSVPASFQFFDGKNAVSPIFIQLEDDENNRYIATLKSGERAVYDLEKRAIGKPILGKLENVYIGLNGEIVLDPMSGTAEPYALHKKRFKTPFENGYLLSSLIGVINSLGKCAIYDAYDKKLVTDFVLNPKSYEIVGVLNLETELPQQAYYVIQTLPEEKEANAETSKKFIIVRENGEFVTELISQKYLWNVKHQEKQSDGSETTFSYVAFAEVDDKNMLKTRVLKIDVESGKLEFELELPMLAEKSLQGEKSFIFAPDGRLVLITAHPEIQASKGAYIIDSDGKVETLLKNVNTEIEYTHHYKKGTFFTYKNPETVGKIALNEKARTFEVSKSEFLNLANKYFGATSVDELRPQLAQIKMPEALKSKKKPAAGSGPNGGEGPAGSGFGE